MAVLTTQRQLRKTKHVEGTFFKCHQCKQVKPVQTSGGTGYGYDAKDRPVCYECCGENDRKDMISTGKAVLYLTCEPASKMRLSGQPYTIATLNQGIGRSTKGTVSNWPGTMKFDCYTTVGHHNIARHRYDCWFTGPDGKRWHGVTYGDNTQICRCRRLKD